MSRHHPRRTELQRRRVLLGLALAAVVLSTGTASTAGMSGVPPVSAGYSSTEPPPVPQPDRARGLESNP